MIVVKKIEDRVNMQLSEENVRLIISALREVTDVIYDFEFYARVGAEKDGSHNLCIALKEAAEKAGVEL